ncbi:uncharacterized protein FOMMEDRAFT_170069, partial [Fomitiporia mediterranea MF3/22]|uniref:uncharacterized protein n=1 Tax=Fomitiporia mediterranea (strain MF3/22) TaxID=694068 RepID=UPI0004409B60
MSLTCRWREGTSLPPPRSMIRIVCSVLTISYLYFTRNYDLLLRGRLLISSLHLTFCSNGRVPVRRIACAIRLRSFLLAVRCRLSP